MPTGDNAQIADISRSIYVLYQSSEKYAPMLGVSVTSLFENNQDVEYLKVFLLVHDMQEESKNKFTKLADAYHREIEFLDMKQSDEYLGNMNIPKWVGSYAPYYKLFAINLLPHYVDRILFIDSDTFVMPGLAEINKIDLPDHALGMVRMPGNKIYMRKLGILKSYSGGVILFNVQNWKKFNCEEIILHNIRIPKPLLAADETLILVSLPQYIAMIPLKFNVDSTFAFYGLTYRWRIFQGTKESPFSEEEAQDAINNPIVAHCAYDVFDRPWEKNGFNPFLNPFKEKWDYFRSMSPWPDFETEKHYSIKRKIMITMCKILPRALFAFIYEIELNRYTYANIRAFEKKVAHSRRLKERGH